MAWRAWENWYLFRDTATILLAFGSVFIWFLIWILPLINS
jgi:hypothetical protein